MQVIHERCCGLDIHKKSVVACLITPQGKQTRTFGTTTREIEQLLAWLRETHCTHVALESTGVYWKPLYNVLEGQGLDLLVVNAYHMRSVPGRKTDVKLRHEVASVAVRPANEEERRVVSEPGSDLGFCPQYPAETCGRSNLAV